MGEIESPIVNENRVLVYQMDCQLFRDNLLDKKTYLLS